jgi:HlyD family secretion protein
VQPASEVARTLGLDRRGGARRWAGRVAWLVLTAGVVAAGAWGLRGALRPKPPQWRTEAARRADVEVSVTATATVQAINTVQVGTEVSGRVARVLVDFNDPVRAGQVLAELDPEPFDVRVREARAQVALAQAGIRQAEAALGEARTTLGRVEALHAREVASQADLDQARSAVARATAALDSARAQAQVAAAALAAATTQRAKTVIRAPIDGVVLARAVEPGQTVNGAFQTAQLFTLAEDLTRMELRADVDEADVGRVREGQAASFTVAAYPGRAFASRVVALRNAPRTVQNVVSYEAILAVDNAERLLRPGMTATVTIVADRKSDVLVVPNAALRFSPPGREAETERKRLGGERHVWRLEGDRPVPVPVEVGVTDGRVTEVRGGEVRAGMPLVVDLQTPD